MHAAFSRKKCAPHIYITECSWYIEETTQKSEKIPTDLFCPQQAYLNHPAQPERQPLNWMTNGSNSHESVAMLVRLSTFKAFSEETFFHLSMYKHVSEMCVPVHKSTYSMNPFSLFVNFLISSWVATSQFWNFSRVFHKISRLQKYLWFQSALSA